MPVTALSNAVSCDVFAGAFPFARPRTAVPAEVLSFTGPAGFAQVISNYTAITIIDSYLSAGEYYKSFPSTYTPPPMSLYRWLIKGGTVALQKVPLGPPPGSTLHLFA